MTRYNKAIGSFVGGVVGALLALGYLPEGIDVAQIEMAITVLGSLIGTYIAPKNKDKD